MRTERLSRPQYAKACPRRRARPRHLDPRTFGADRFGHDRRRAQRLLSRTPCYPHSTMRGDLYRVVDALYREAGVRKIFSDWPCDPNLLCQLLRSSLGASFRVTRPAFLYAFTDSRERRKAERPLKLTPYPQICDAGVLRATVIASAIDLVGGILHPGTSRNRRDVYKRPIPAYPEAGNALRL